MAQLCFLLLVLFFQSIRCDDSRTRQSLRTRQDHKKLDGTDSWKIDDSSSKLHISASRQRDLSSIVECRQSTEMEIPLIPANMKYTLHNSGSNVKEMRPQMAPSNAHLTFCLDRVYLDFSYILDVGTLVTDLDIDCPHLAEPVHFLEPNYVLSAAANTRSRFFVNGKYPGQVHLKNEEVLRILAAGDNCEFKVRAYNFDDGLLIGHLRGGAFKNVH